MNNSVSVGQILTEITQKKCIGVEFTIASVSLTIGFIFGCDHFGILGF
jgi:hypothetical protein